MGFIAKSVAITKANLEKGFNADSFNINGRCVTAANANSPKGYKMAGQVSLPFLSAVASSMQNSFAPGSLNALNEYNFNRDDERQCFRAVQGYFEDMGTVVKKTGIKDAELNISLISATEEYCIAGRMGNCHILRFTGSDLFEVALPSQDKPYRVQVIDNICDGDIFILLGSHTSSMLDYERILKILENVTDLKMILRRIFEMTGNEQDATIVLTKFIDENKQPVVDDIKIAGAAEKTAAAFNVPTESAKTETASNTETKPQPEKRKESETEKNDEENRYIPSKKTDTGDETAPSAPEAEPASTEEEPEIIIEKENTSDKVAETDAKDEKIKPMTTKRRILNAIPIAILIVLLAVAGALYLASHTKVNPVKKPAEHSNEAAEQADVSKVDLGEIVDVNETPMQTVEAFEAREYANDYGSNSDSDGEEYNENSDSENSDEENGGEYAEEDTVNE